LRGPLRGKATRGNGREEMVAKGKGGRVEGKEEQREHREEDGSPTFTP